MNYLTIRKKEYPIHFGLGAIKLFMKRKGLTKMSELQDVFKGMTGDSDMSMESIDNFTLIVLSAVEFACKVERCVFDLIPEDIEFYIIGDEKQQALVSDLLAESLSGDEVAVEEGNTPKKESSEVSETLNGSESETSD